MDGDVQPSKDYLEWYASVYTVRLFSMLFPFDNSCHFGSDIFGASAYFRLSSNSDIANMIAPEVVTKPESVTLEELFSYMKQKSSKVQELFFFSHITFISIWLIIYEV